ncbi:MAG: DUF1572 family protein, partial [Dinghuibacter sp.]|nr:DUF1572 family protein [Dinghuibacter sp.]
EAVNSIAITVQHLWGNMLSRWTDMLTTDGEKEWRNRDAEFEQAITTRAELLERWEAGWNCVFSTLTSLTPADLDTIIYIRNMGQTVTDAISRQLCHYSYHVGQIIFMGKLQAAGNWASLSIPKGNSQAYNAEKFAQPQHIAPLREGLEPEKNA